MRTSTPQSAQASWFETDASGQHLGRLAARIAHILRGKHKVSWSPHQVMSDHVIVTNASQIVLMGKKLSEKVYFRHSGHLGHLKRLPASRLLAENPASLITRAVRGMLPRNRLRKRVLQHLHVYPGPEHPHEAQNPKQLETLFPKSSPS